MRQLLLASGNPGKLQEIKALLDDLPIQLVTPFDLGLYLDVVEDGITYEENATRKALAYASASGLCSLADDSGLEVEALNGSPGLYSARFAPQPGATDADRRAYLLRKLHGYPRPWLARFRCVVVLAVPGDRLYSSEGICPGEVIPQERGQLGFGYDPIFLISGADQTMAELSMEEKNRLSHRAKAVLGIRPILLAIV